MPGNPHRNSSALNSIFTPDFFLTLSPSPDSRGEGGIRGYFAWPFMQGSGSFSGIITIQDHKFKIWIWKMKVSDKDKT
jgi:hypothetical protein